MAFVYFIRSKKDSRLYIGSTENLSQRLSHHFGHHTPTTKRFGEIEIAFYQEYKTLKEARSIERKLKKLKRKDYLEKIIKDRQIKMKP
ncbi:MAG: GIY-YIG nuclease family protein [Candidatus Giovannonibacteria bacterium]|nr:GIY-YIG nuclease family protein [Candidatus Giovannonibacteria bacterium]